MRDNELSSRRGVAPSGRVVRLGKERLLLPWSQPVVGSRLGGGFAVPAARRAERPLTAESLAHGWVLVSTLPNIRRHACIAQIIELEELAHAYVERARIVHVSADEGQWWREVDLYHADVQAEGYSLHDAEDASRIAFGRAFGVGVHGHRRIAHGLFALEDGEFRVAEVPEDQLGTPDVAAFLVAVARGTGACIDGSRRGPERRS